MNRRELLGSSAAAMACGLGGPVFAQAGPQPAGPQRPPPGPPAPPPPATIPRPERDIAGLRSRLEARLARLVSEDGFAGVARLDVAGKPVVRTGEGVADPRTSRAFRSDTQVEMASIGKTFTAAAILKLRDQGKLRIDAPISAVLPGVPADKSGITIFHLLTGSSGLPHTAPVNDGLDRAGCEARVLALPLAAPPGREFIYSNAGFNLLGAIVERTSGRDYETYLRDEILKPAGAFHTGYAAAYDAAIAATDRSGTPLPQAAWGGDRPDWNIIGAGGLVTTADDMMAWHYVFMDGKVVSPRSVQEGTTGYIDQGPNAPPGKYSYGRCVTEHQNYGKMVWHNGGDPAFTSYFTDIPDHGLTLFISSNTADATLAAYKLLRAVFGVEDTLPGAGTRR